MAARTGRRNQPEYRSLRPPKPDRMILAFWPKQRPPNRASAEFLKALEAGCRSAPAI